MSELLCNDCLDTGWLEDKAGRSVCSCIAETDPYQQLQAECERLRKLLKQALRHIEDAGDDTLAAIIDTQIGSDTHA